ncbi:MAG: cyclic nucleotide-binding domain-containing protein [Polyangiales bacterium]
MEGRVSHACFLLVEGQVELYFDRPPQRHQFRYGRAGEFFGHDAVLCRDPQRWSSRTLGPATLLRFDSATLQTTLERGGPLSTLIHERLAVSSARQLRDANALLLRAEPAVELAVDAEAYIARTAARAGVSAEVLEMRVMAVPDLGTGWKRR